MSKQKILHAYEELAENYNRLIDHKPHNAYYDRPNTLSLLPEIQGKNVLDAGCGPGKYAEILLERGAAVTGFDFSPTMVALARERNKGKGYFFVHDLTEPLPMFADASFDVVLCALALDYVEDWNPTLREWYRVLKPGGKLVMSIEHPVFKYEYHQSKRYFDVENVSGEWRGFGKPVMVNSFRRPLQACLSPLLDNGFRLERLLEPRPVEAFKALDPRHYHELNTFPAFMCLCAAK